MFLRLFIIYLLMKFFFKVINLLEIKYLNEEKVLRVNLVVIIRERCCIEFVRLLSMWLMVVRVIENRIVFLEVYVISRFVRIWDRKREIKGLRYVDVVIVGNSYRKVVSIWEKIFFLVWRLEIYWYCFRNWNKINF